MKHWRPLSVSRTLAIGLLLLGSFGTATAQANITPEKKAAIRELIALINPPEQAAQSVDILLSNVKRQTDALQTQLLTESKEISPEIKQRLITFIEARVAKLTVQIKDLYARKYDALNEAFLGIYDKHFNESEIKELYAFYKTPLGQKILTQTPQLLRELTEASNNVLNAELLQITREALDGLQKEIATLIVASEPPRPAPKPARRRKVN